MSPMKRCLAVFTSPKEAFESLEAKPTWLIPFILVSLAAIASRYINADIFIDDAIAGMQAKGNTAAEIDTAVNYMTGPFAYIGYVLVPVFTGLIWLAIAGVFTFVGNTIGGGAAKFKRLFSMVAWSGLIGIVAAIVQTFLIASKGTSVGVGINLAILLPTPEIGEAKSMLYRFLAQVDIFALWQVGVWAAGFTAIYKFTYEKSLLYVGTVWGVYVLGAVLIGGLFG